MAKDKPAPAGAPAWMVTFADLMSLLVCFFVLIISFSTQDDKKLQVVAGSVRDAFGVRRDWEARALIEIDGRPKTHMMNLPQNHNVVVYMPRPDRPPPEDAEQDDEVTDPTHVAGEARQRQVSEEILASAADFLEISDYAGESLHARIGDPGADGGKADPGTDKPPELDWRETLERRQFGTGLGPGAGAGAGPGAGPGAGKTEAEQKAAAATAAAEQQFVEDVKERIQALAEERPEIAELIDNLKVERSDKGVRIELIDDISQPMFQLGSSDLDTAVKPLVAEVAKLVAGTKNRLLITGHTDARPFRGRAAYDNWNLSSDRAHATRRALIAAGVPPTQIAGVIGKGASDPAIKAAPNDARNRRIGILLLREGDNGA